jgi:hypothetical protein
MSYGADAFKIAKMMGRSSGGKPADPADGLPEPLRSDFKKAFADMDAAKTPAEIEAAKNFAFDLHARIRKWRSTGKIEPAVAKAAQPDLDARFPKALRAEYLRAMDGLANPKDERQASEARAVALIVASKIRDWRDNVLGAERAKDTTIEQMLAELTGSPSSRFAGLPDGLRRQTELALAAKSNTPEGRRQAEECRAALEAHKSEAQSLALIKSAHRTPQTFFRKD